MSGTASEQITHREESQEGGQEAASTKRGKNKFVLIGIRRYFA